MKKVTLALLALVSISSFAGENMDKAKAKNILCSSAMFSAANVYNFQEYPNDSFGIDICESLMDRASYIDKDAVKWIRDELRPVYPTSVNDKQILNAIYHMTVVVNGSFEKDDLDACKGFGALNCFLDIF